VSIFDARGRRVRDIVGTVTSASGVTWQGDDALGKRVSGGVYFWVQSCRDGVDWSPRYRGKISLLR
jgi:hypothetical protein